MGLQTHLVMLFNKDAPPTPRLQRFAEHSTDSFQLVPDVRWDVTFGQRRLSDRVRVPAGPVFAIMLA